MKAITLLFFSLFLASCAQPVMNKFDSHSYKIPIGSLLILNQDITIPGGHTRVIIQNGHVVSGKQRDQYYPYCEFEVLTLKQTDQVVHPDKFRIRKLSKQMDTSRQQMFASLSMFGRDTPLIAYNTVMYLSSQVQPDVYRMSCMYWTDDNMDSYLTQHELQKTVGNIFSFVIND